jgi:hypothetical protein
MNLSTKIKPLRSSAPKKDLLFLVILGVLLSSDPGLVRAQEEGSPENTSQALNFPFDSKQQSFNDAKNDFEIFDFKPELWNKDQKTPAFTMLSIDP